MIIPKWRERASNLCEFASHKPPQQLNKLLLVAL